MLMLRSALFALFALFCATFAAPTFAAGPTIDIVLGEKADPLEKFAADEMAGQLKKLFNAEVRIGTSLPADSKNIILVGTEQSNPHFKTLGLNLPAVLQQDHALKSYPHEGSNVLVVVGANPQSVLWAGYELGWRLGIRYFTFGDLYPTAPPAFTTAGFDVTIRPTAREIAWNPTFASPLDFAPWGIDDARAYLRQLAKLRYRTIVLGAGGAQLGGKETGLPIAITGDTMGRAAFKGKRVFDNPSLEQAGTPEARAAAAKELIQQLRDEAQRLGIEVVDATATAESLTVADMLVSPNSDYYQVANSRLDVDERFSQVTIISDILTSVCGAEVDTRVQQAFDQCDRAAVLVNRHDDQLGALQPKMLLRHYDSDEPPPGWWNDARTHYLNAMNEMYRANTRAREGGRAFTLYYARRFEFGYEYMNTIEAIRKAGIAKRKGDNDTQIAELEKAIDSVTNACNAMAAVARSQSDRGVIAVMNEYGYRPLLKLLEEADAAN